MTILAHVYKRPDAETAAFAGSREELGGDVGYVQREYWR